MAGTTRLPFAAEPSEADAPDGSNVLVLSSSLNPSSDPVSTPFRLAGALERPLVYVALARSDLTRLEDWLATAGAAPEVRLVDATPGPPSPPSDVPATSVPAPDALTDLGIGMTEAMAATGSAPVCSFRSLTALRQYVGRRRTYRFLNAAVDRTAADAAVAWYGVDPCAFPDRDLRALAPLFDAVHDQRASA